MTLSPLRFARILRVASALALAALLCLAGGAEAAEERDPIARTGVFPFYNSGTSLDGQTTETRVLWPFVSSIETSTTLTHGLHPLFSTYREKDTGRRGWDLLWPFVTWRSKPRTWTGTDREIFTILPIYYASSGNVDGVETRARALLPFYFSGSQGKRGRYFVLFPFIWFAQDALLPVPLFPRRPQTFAALWPLLGDFRGYWNRDRISFALWPLYVRSEDGKGDDYNTMTSIVWPIFGWRGGPKTSGFRLWPLVNYVKKDGEFTRASYLWPLGLYREGVSGKDTTTTESVRFFFPFYADIANEQFHFQMLFPFYGKMDQKGRKTRGYALAIYNEDDNLRRGIREHRILWFLIRWTTRIQPLPEAEAATVEDAPVGGGVFPFYTERMSPTMKRQSIFWPFIQKRWDKEPEYEYDRLYIVPFYSDQQRRYNDGTRTSSTFIFPLFRLRKHADGRESFNSLHFWWYDNAEPVDRNYSPIWTFYESRKDARTGAERKRVCKFLYDYERTASGEERTRWDALLVQGGTHKPADPAGPTREKFSILWGLYGTEEENEQVTMRRVLWIPFRSGD